MDHSLGKYMGVEPGEKAERKGNNNTFLPSYMFKGFRLEKERHIRKVALMW